MNILSLFDGMSCGQVVLQKLGAEVEQYFASEIKEEGIKVTQHNFSNTVQLGDITKLTTDMLPKIDLLIGGSPCQDLSIAMKDRTGLAGIKSKLFFEYMRVLKEVNPKYFLLENVGSMRESDKDIISGLVGVQPIMIDAQLVSAQKRKRYYWTNIPGVTQPSDKGIKLNDILMDGYSEKEKANCLVESGSRPLTTPLKMMHRHMTTGMTTLIFWSKRHYKECMSHYKAWFKGLSAKQIDSAVFYMKIDLEIYGVFNNESCLV